MVAAKPLIKRKIVKKYTGTFKRFQSDAHHTVKVIETNYITNYITN